MTAAAWARSPSKGFNDAGGERYEFADGRIVSERDGRLHIVTIDRPAKLNGFTPKMMRELALAISACDEDREARCAVVKAEGPHFTAGLDLPERCAEQLGRPASRPIAATPSTSGI